MPLADLNRAYVCRTDYRTDGCDPGGVVAQCSTDLADSRRGDLWFVSNS